MMEVSIAITCYDWVLLGCFVWAARFFKRNIHTNLVGRGIVHDVFKNVSVKTLIKVAVVACIPLVNMILGFVMTIFFFAFVFKAAFLYAKTNHREQYDKVARFLTSSPTDL